MNQEVCYGLGRCDKCRCLFVLRMKFPYSLVDLQMSTAAWGVTTMAQEWNVLALHKGAEQYLFIYDDHSVPSLIDSFRRFAAEDALSFNWFDAAVMTEKCKAHTPVLAEGRNDVTSQSTGSMELRG